MKCIGQYFAQQKLIPYSIIRTSQDDILCAPDPMFAVPSGQGRIVSLALPPPGQLHYNKMYYYLDLIKLCFKTSMPANVQLLKHP